MLNPIFEIPEYKNVTDIIDGMFIGKKNNASNPNPITKLDNGPTIEIIISDLGVLGSSSILETPPNK